MTPGMKAPQDNPFIDPGDVSFAPIDDGDAGHHAREAADLATAIRFHDHRYYVLDDPRLADGTYDALFRRLQALEEAFPALQSADSPTQRVGGTVKSELPEIEHQAPMQSLDSGAEETDVRDFDERVTASTTKSRTEASTLVEANLVIPPPITTMFRSLIITSMNYTKTP